jgi:hypothetical protein
MDNFVLKRVTEDERRLRAEYNRDLSQERLEWALETCYARRQLVTLYRTSRDRHEVHEAYALCLSVIAELYGDHPTYDRRWRPMTIVPAAHLSNERKWHD